MIGEGRQLLRGDELSVLVSAIVECAADVVFSDGSSDDGLTALCMDMARTS
jgi:hypothetical protein